MAKEKEVTQARSQAEGDKRANGVDAKPSAQEKGKTKSKLPVWIDAAIRKPRVWKTWVRCMVATFATLVLMLAQPCKSLIAWQISVY